MDKKNTFSLIEMHPTELAANRGKWEELLEKYKIHNIKEYFGCSFADWVALPNDLVNRQIDFALRWRGDDLRETANQNTALSNLLGGK